ncbi:hypothetical protein [Rhizobium leguminosarum]|uniref:hypothetical protein n=1 Tax=Rhizobium leguminosarum TaxID=384 RepID=UPI001AEF7831|nr:hypothetical protein [Rhizobium leguminosarum]
MEESAVDFFLRYFRNDLGSFVIASSVHANSDEVGHYGDAADDERGSDLIKGLVRSGLIKEFSYKKRFGRDPGSQKYSESVEKEWADSTLMKGGISLSYILDLYLSQRWLCMDCMVIAS